MQEKVKTEQMIQSIFEKKKDLIVYCSNACDNKNVTTDHVPYGSYCPCLLRCMWTIVLVCIISCCLFGMSLNEIQ